MLLEPGSNRGGFALVDATGGSVADRPRWNRLGLRWPYPGGVIDLDVEWMHGRPARSSVEDPPLQVHWVDPDTAILRQSKQLTYEAPFLFLLLGGHTALLLDTGAVRDPAAMPLEKTVAGLVEAWQSRQNPGDAIADASQYRLVVAHTHAHSDHVAADAQFSGRAATTVVGTGVADVVEYFGFEAWPAEVVTFDLGGRVLEITGCPGHHESAIAIFDPQTRLLLTGDSIYPGRLYVGDMPAFVDSLDRLAPLAEQRQVSAVIGCHIEMTGTPGLDYPIGTKYQPDEPKLAMTLDRLCAVRDAAHEVASHPGVHVFDDFIIFNGRCVGGVVRQLARAWRDRVRSWVRR